MMEIFKSASSSVDDGESMTIESFRLCLDRIARRVSKMKHGGDAGLKTDENDKADEDGKRYGKRRGKDGKRRGKDEKRGGNGGGENKENRRKLHMTRSMVSGNDIQPAHAHTPFIAFFF